MPWRIRRTFQRDGKIKKWPEWLRLFRRHHAQLLLQKPEATSLARATSFNKPNISQFFNNLATTHDRFGPFEPRKIYNLDETGLMTI